MKSITRLALRSSCAALVLAVAPFASAQSGEEVLKNVCAACHLKREDGTYERIDAVRKTPEAWDMTVVRMMRNHHVPLSPEDRTGVVRYLASTRGLSVAETQGWRYVLEKEPVATDEPPNQLMAESCGRCHTYARVAMQRRTQEDWKKLINFHLGQFPTIELQALARDRDWWAVAHNEVLPFLATNYPLGDAPKASTAKLAGDWVLAGHKPGRGDYSGKLSLASSKVGYDVKMTLNYAKGSETYKGSGVLLGEGEWRASLTNGKTEIRQVFALTAKGALEGRWFEKENEVSGGRLAARPVGSAPQILAASPAYLRVGAPSLITLTGVGLSGQPVLPKGVTGQVVSQSPEKVVLKLTASEALGSVNISMGQAQAPLVVFSKLDRVGVEPQTTISRVGGNGGPIPKTPAQFDAIGYLNGKDGKPGTEDDVRVGSFAASWKVDNWDDVAVATKDAQYSGSIDQSGLFVPADAGPNPERPMSANNIGNLKVIATVDDQNQKLSGEAHLYATVQRFIDPPIR